MKTTMYAVYPTASASILYEVKEKINALQVQVKKLPDKIKRKAFRFILAAFSPVYERTQNKIIYTFGTLTALYFIGHVILQY